MNAKPLIGNLLLIEALKAVQTPEKTIAAAQYFNRAYRASRLGRSEVTEQIVANSVAILSSDTSIEERNTFFAFAKDVVVRQNQVLKSDARFELLTGSFLSTTGQLDEALVHLERAKELMPGKQQIYFEIGAVYINQNKPFEALKSFKEAYELAPEYDEAKIIYLIGAIYAGDRTLEARLIAELPKVIVARDGRISSAYRAVGR